MKTINSDMSDQCKLLVTVTKDNKDNIHISDE